MAKVIALFEGALTLTPEEYPQLYPIAENKADVLEQHLIELAKKSYKTDHPSQSQINSVANFLDNDLRFQ